jgi:Flp pilus assembly protein TadG
MGERTAPLGLGRTRHRSGERGAVALLSALVVMVLMVIAAFVVDIGTTWMRRGELQQQADGAAMFAAEALPAADDAERLVVAKRVAHYVACHLVVGQRTLDPTIPDCPTSSGSATLTAYAQQLLDDGKVTFPSSTQVQVVGPEARVDYVWAGATGASNVTQSKSATAKVSSPGGLLPVGLSLQCLASMVNSAGLGAGVDKILPISYVVPGNFASSGSLPTQSEPALLPWDAAYTGANASASVTLANPSATESTLTLSVDSPSLLALDLTGKNQVVFKRGGTTVGPVNPASLDPLTKTLTVAIPDEVKNTPGRWYVKVKLFTTALLLFGGSPKWSDGTASFDVYPAQSSVAGSLLTALGGLLDLDSSIACGRLLDSPRVLDAGTPALTRNLQEGLDHSITRNEAFVQALGGADLSALNGSASGMTAALGGAVAGVLANPAYGLTGCAGTAYNRLDTQATYDATLLGGAPANCVRLRSDAAAEQEFTDGMLKATASDPTEPGYGRLSCNRTSACTGGRTVDLTDLGFGGLYNNDSFSDFLKSGQGTLLDSNLAFALDTYLLPNLPLITPNDRVEDEIYSSPRFGWVPVLSYVNLNAPGEVDYPVLTFRPVFIDNGTAETLNIAGMQPTGVVDRLNEEVQEGINEAIDAVTASLGILGPIVSTFLDGIGITTALNQLSSDNIDQGLQTLSNGLGIDMGRERAGLVVQGGKLKAARFMTIAPDALPPVGSSYDGPTVDYVGVGPRIIRLVK